MKLWNLETLLEEIKFKVAFNQGQTDLEFAGPSGDADRHFRDALNEAYSDELRDAKQSSDPRWFYCIQTLVWPSGQLTLDLPAGMDVKGLISIHDITDSDPGYALWFNTWEQNATHLWRKRATMQWGDAGPAADKTLRFTYMGDAHEMQHGQDEPILLPNEFRHLIAWTGAAKLRLIADDEYPRGWDRHMNNIREGMLKFFSNRGPLQTAQAGVLNTFPEFRIYT